MATGTGTGSEAGTATQNHYDVLGIERRATQDDVRSAYRLRSHMFHPDKYENYPEPLRSQLKAEAAKEFKKLTTAYDTLRDPQKRAAHDRQLDAQWVRPPVGRATTRGTRTSSARTTRASTTRHTPGRATVRDAAEADAEEAKQAERQERARRRAAEAAAQAARPRERDPHLVVRPDELDFGAMALGTTKQLPLKIANAGGRTLFGEITSNRSWLVVNRRSFVSSSVMVLVSVDTNGLRAGEEYTGALAVTTLNGGDQVVPVSVRVSGRPEPLLAGVPSLLDFGTAEGGTAGTKTRTIRLTNAGTGTLIGSIAIRYGGRDAAGDGAGDTNAGEAPAGQGARAAQGTQAAGGGEGQTSGPSHASQGPEWLSVSETRFRANDFSFEVIARTAGLIAGEHRAEVLVFTNGGQARIQTVIQITPGAVLSRREEPDSGATGPSIQNPKSPIQNSVADLDKKDREALLKRIVLIEPETVFEREFLRRIVHLVRSGTSLAPGELAKIYELEARQPAEDATP